MKTDYPREDQIPELKTLWAKCFPDPASFIDGFFDMGFSRERCRCIDGGKAALYWFNAGYRDQKMAYLYAVATDPAYRGRGLCRELMKDTQALLEQQGYTAALLLPGEPGLRAMYRKMGYRDCCEIAEITCEAGGNVVLEEISWQEYETLRPRFLPEDGAIQAGLEYLSSYAAFYRWENGILVAVKEGTALLGLELLGDPAMAPGILTALGCEKGTFRTPGKSKSTVMALPLREAVALPGYLGLTFD